VSRPIPTFVSQTMCSALDDPYTPHLGTPSSPESASRMRHDFVVLAGFSWRSD
jgi:hypothetical protein